MKAILKLLFGFIMLITTVSAQDYSKSHIHANHICNGSVANNCFGYAQARAMGKTVGDAFCDPQASYADGIDLTKFYFVDDPALNGIKMGDIVILNANNRSAGHAAVISYVPNPFVRNNILVDQVPGSNGAEELNQNLGTQIARYGEPIGYCPTGYWKRVSVVLLNNFDDGILEADKRILTDYPYGGQPIPKPADVPDPYPFMTVGNGCWALFAPESGTTITTLVQAKDNQSYDDFDRKFVRWEKDNGKPYGTELLLEEQESGSCTYTAIFAKVFEITCQNDFAGNSGGIISVEGTTRDAGWVEPVIEDILYHNGQITLQAVNNQVISGTKYIFDHWSTGGTSNPCTFTVTNHQPITAVFKDAVDLVITGPYRLDDNELGTFTANPSGGSGSYVDYKWWSRNDDGTITPFSLTGGVEPDAPLPGIWLPRSSWDGLRTVTAAHNYNFSLKCEVTDSEGQTTTDIHSVIVGAPLLAASQQNEEMAINSVPAEFSLQGNYPNPFNPVTTIRFGLPEAANVKLVIYSVTGAKVATLVDGYMSEGYHEAQWNGVNQAGARVASGIYIYELISGEKRFIKKMLLAK